MYIWVKYIYPTLYIPDYIYYFFGQIGPFVDQQYAVAAIAPYQTLCAHTSNIFFPIRCVHHVCLITDM